MAWIALLLSGTLEAAWAIALELSDGFSRPWPSLAFVVFGIASFAGLACALKTLPAGSAYAAWTGVGAALTAIIGMIWLGEAVTVGKLVSLALIVGGVVGLNLAGGAH